jgi:Amt family ammonium transporter
MHKRNRALRRLLALAICSILLTMFGTRLYAQDTTAEPAAAEEAAPAEEAAVVEETVETAFATSDEVANVRLGLDTMWLLLTGFLVFFMQAGFAMLEAGLIRQTGVVNALMENFMDAGLTAVVFWAVGFGFAFGTSAGGFIGTDNFFLSNAIVFGGEAGITYTPFLGTNMLTFFFFQFAFAATASTIATGGMAERTDFIGDIIYSALIALFVYPVVVHWVWGGGWLATQGFLDFAGSTVVHLCGAIIGLVGAMMLGARTGRVWGKPFRPHNLGYAALGTFILWFGWYGFNPGSALGMGDNGLVGLVTVNTTLAAAAGAAAAVLFGFFRTGKWDLPSALNGSLGGLVGITAGCAFLTPTSSVFVGVVGGILVLLTIDLFEILKIDDAVGAFAVHGACGAMGTLAIGFLGVPELGAAGLLMGGSADQLITQVIGIVAVSVWTGATMTVVFFALKALGLLRISAKAEAMGIDVYEHGATLWPDVLPFPEDTPAGSTGKKAPVGAGD